MFASFMLALFLQLLCTPPSVQCTNVLFVIADDLRPEIGAFTDDDDTFYPGIKTPNFDAFAQDSLVLNRAYVQIALCAPSRNSILTGKHFANNNNKA